MKGYKDWQTTIQDVGDVFVLQYPDTTVTTRLLTENFAAVELSDGVHRLTWDLERIKFQLALNYERVIEGTVRQMSAAWQPLTGTSPRAPYPRGVPD